MPAPVSIIVPTRGPRLGYLDVALRSVAPQAAAHGAELLVVHDDPADAATRELVLRHGGRYVAHGAPRGINVARNTGLEAATGDLLCLLDDDVEPWPIWLTALLEGAAANPSHEAFGGPIRPRLEDGRLRACGREPLPITQLDLGRADRDAERLWGANLALRRAAVERVGGFDPTLNWAGDEEDWEDRLVAAGGRMRYVARAGVDHRRAGADATLRSLARAARNRGRAARRWDRRRGAEPSLAHEARVLAGCAWHAGRRRCGNGLVLGAHSAGRLQEALRPTVVPVAAARTPPAPDYLSGESGTLGCRASLLGAARDLATDVLLAPRRLALRRAAARAPRRRVLAVGVARPQHARLAAAAARELEGSRHDVTVRLVPPEAGAGKWANLNRALAATPAAGHDWLLVVDDDVVLPRGFLDAFVLCCERRSLTLAQPAHRHASHAAWRVTRRRAATVVRETAFVEIGPVTAVHARAFDALLPFPDLNMGWGLDAHWGGLAAERGWRLGVVDATPVRHTRPVAGDYGREAALAEAAAFLADRPYVTREAAQRTLAGHRRW